MSAFNIYSVQKHNIFNLSHFFVCNLKTMYELKSNLQVNNTNIEYEYFIYLNEPYEWVNW